MAALNFPASPTVGQIYTANGRSWKWDGASWISANQITSIGVTGSTMTIYGSPIAHPDATSLTFANSVALTAASTKTLTLNGGAGSNGLVIDASNNVGAGGTNQYARLSSTITDSTSYFSLGLSGTTKGLRVQHYSGYTAVTGVDNTLVGSYQPLQLGGSYLTFAYSGSTIGMTLDTSGNLGLGVTPSGWGSGFKALQINSQSALWASSTATFLSNNIYNNGANNIYINSTYASRYYQLSGSHIWENAPSGTAGNAITFTQAMTLDASGNLLVGTTSNPIAATGRTVTFINGSSESLLGFGIGGSTTAYLQSQSGSFNLVSAGIAMNISATGANSITFNTNSVSRVGISSSGVVSIANLAGTGSRAVNADASGNLSAASDSSLKQEDKKASIPGLTEILKITPKAYKWLADVENRGDEAATEIGFFADEVAPIIPSAAPKCADGLYGFYDRSITAALVKAIQELSAELNELKQRIK